MRGNRAPALLTRSLEPFPQADGEIESAPSSALSSNRAARSNRPLVRVSAYLQLLERSTHDGDRVRLAYSRRRSKTAPANTSPRDATREQPTVEPHFWRGLWIQRGLWNVLGIVSKKGEERYSRPLADGGCCRFLNAWMLPALVR